MGLFGKIDIIYLNYLNNLCIIRMRCIGVGALPGLQNQLDGKKGEVDLIIDKYQYAYEVSKECSQCLHLLHIVEVKRHIN